MSVDFISHGLDSLIDVISIVENVELVLLVGDDFLLCGHFNLLVTYVCLFSY